MSDILSTGKSAQKRAQKQQEQALGKQKQIEETRLAEEKSEIERRKALGARGAGGRSLLIATSQTGTNGQAQTLGGQ